MSNDLTQKLKPRQGLIYIMKVIKMEDIDIKSLKLYHTNKNHYNSKIYYKDSIYTTVYNRAINLYNMFIIDER